MNPKMNPYDPAFPADPDDPAFPAEWFDESTGQQMKFAKGLTKREYFAAIAMQGILAQQEVKGGPEDLAIAACLCADALIKELSK